MDPETARRRADRRTLALLGGVATAMLLFLLSLPPAGALLGALSGAGLIACPFHALTGIPCPGCGGTRALLRLASADPSGAFALNPLVSMAVLGALSLAALALLAPSTCDRVLDRGGRFLSTRAGRLLLGGMLLAEVVFAAR
jgi:hypothetical protein